MHDNNIIWHPLQCCIQMPEMIDYIYSTAALAVNKKINLFAAVAFIPSTCNMSAAPLLP